MTDGGMEESERGRKEKKGRRGRRKRRTCLKKCRIKAKGGRNCKKGHKRK